MEKANLNPSYVVGGIIPEVNTNGKYAENKYFSAELDESDGTIQKYATDIAIINNMEEDHLDFYKNGFSDITKTFNKYLSNKPNQKVLINYDNEGCREFISLYPNYNYITFGLKEADYVAKNIKQNGLSSSFEIFKGNNFITELNLSIPGIHNIYNALAVFSALNEAEVDTNKIKHHFSTFSGMGRRFQKVAEINGIEIYDDYAHHPSEITTTLKCVKDAVGSSKRIVAIFQPHRYTRLQGLWADFKSSFKSADLLFITDVYSAGEEPIKNITSEIFANELSSDNAKYIDGDINSAATKIYPHLKKDDIVITLGAGSITKMGSCLADYSKG